MTPLPPSPFVTEPERRFVLNEADFVAAIESAPAFPADPSPEYRFGRMPTLPQQENANV